MNFEILKKILISMKEKLRCPHCGKSISNRELFIEGITFDSALIRTSCRRCMHQIIAEIVLVPDHEPQITNYSTERVHHTLKVKAKAYTHISNDYILDMKNFLKKWSGNFKDLFKNKQ